MLTQQLVDQHEGGLGRIMTEGADANGGARGLRKDGNEVIGTRSENGRARIRMP
jgi:hypothetical protein